MPNGGRVRWKDLRSGMACHLLSKGWQPHEINLRLGHTPNSDTLNAYLNFLAVDRHLPKRKLYESNVEMLQGRLDQATQHQRLARGRMQEQREETNSLDWRTRNYERRSIRLGSRLTSSGQRCRSFSPGNLRRLRRPGSVHIAVSR